MQKRRIPVAVEMGYTIFQTLAILCTAASKGGGVCSRTLSSLMNWVIRFATISEMECGLSILLSDEWRSWRPGRGTHDFTVRRIGFGNSLTPFDQSRTFYGRDISP